MPAHYNPAVGDWYRNANGDNFEVVALDEADATVEIQYFDGSVEEVELENWNELAIEPIEPPEDWSGSLDIERSDYGVDLDNDSHDRRASPFEDLDREE
jgi:hypothetical protein